MIRGIIILGVQMLITFDHIQAQTELIVGNTTCSTIQVQRSVSIDYNLHEQYNIFILYKQLGPGVWYSSKKKLTSESSTKYEKLEPNTYVITRIHKNSQIFYGLNDKSQQRAITSNPINIHPCDLLYNKSAKEETTSDLRIQIFPNPAANEIFLNGDLGSDTSLTSFRIINAMGITVQEAVLQGELDKINIQTLPNGYYFVYVMIEQGVIFKGPFIVVKR